MTFYCASGLEVDTLSSSIWTFINSISFLFINVAVCECSTGWSCSTNLWLCDVSTFSNALTFSSNTAISADQS